ncbi:unnamed protein product [Gemmata massiliana]|uniref:Uncharacterized protein n=1 Tax=Gemmata massiliana TaxID=1210884 RepID=A0A6P2CYC0_9BACT|nr:hypothetical protein [Gemmata massiliana]VTR93547.1 unnamed protein product [Gemmata massiliana]
MSSTAEPVPPARTRWHVWLLLALAVLVVFVGAALWLWQRYDPFVHERPDMREAKVILDAARVRPLTDDEFERAIALLDSQTPAVQVFAIAAIEAEVARQPARRERALAALERFQKSAPPDTRRASGTAITRMKGAEKQP